MLEPDYQERRRRWRLLLGPQSEEGLIASPENAAPLLASEDGAMDATLNAAYNSAGGFSYIAQGSNDEKSTSDIVRWLKDIHSSFVSESSFVIIRDAINTHEIESFLLQPEALEIAFSDADMAAMLLRLKRKLPDASLNPARQIVRKVIEDIQIRMEPQLRGAVTGALKRRAHSPRPSLSAVDWHTTIRKNLGRYDPERGVLIPDRFLYFERGQERNPWHVILMLDQSASMTGSALYAVTAASILASIPMIETNVAVFDSDVTNLTEACRDSDPVDLLFGLSFEGGTDIGRAVDFCSAWVAEPKRTLMILISDLYESGDTGRLVSRVYSLTESGVSFIIFPSLIDRAARPSYNEPLATALAAVGAYRPESSELDSPGPDGLPMILESVFSGRYGGSQ